MDGTKHYGMELGTVVNDEHPDGLGWVQVTVQGLIAAPGIWAPPIGNAGGGSAQRGDWHIPRKGSTVALFFHRGDPERPYYMPAHYGNRKSGTEVPTPLKDVPLRERQLVKVMETDSWVVLYDDRKGKDTLRIAHKLLEGLSLEMDGVKGAALLKAESFIRIECPGIIDIDGGKVQINGRAVLPSPKPLG